MANREIYPGGLYPLAGDVQSTAGLQTAKVVGLQGIPLVGTPADQDVITYVESANQYQPRPAAGSANKSVQVNSKIMSDDYLATVNYTNGFPPIVAGIATFRLADTIPGIVVNTAATSWIIGT